MKITKYLTTALLALAGVALVAPSAKAQNAFYNDADLVLYFQNPGGATGSDQTVMLSLGNSALVFRDASSNLINTANIGTLLTNTFGSNWWELTTLYMGVAANQGTSGTSPTLVNNDPSRTLYIGDSREGVGTVGSANSAGYTLSIPYGAASFIATQNQVLEVSGSTAAAAFDTTTSQVDNQNLFTSPGQQGLAFNTFAGGVQYQFGVGAFGTMGDAGAVEGALDLYRIARNDNGWDDGVAPGVGKFLGTVTINQSGQVSYVVVPEPSTGVLIGLAGLFGMMARRRRQGVSA
jgi:hypothetical protein